MTGISGKKSAMTVPLKSICGDEMLVQPEECTGPARTIEGDRPRPDPAARAGYSDSAIGAAPSASITKAASAENRVDSPHRPLRTCCRLIRYWRTSGPLE